MPPAPFESVPFLLDQRPGFRLRGEWGYVSVLQGGGHICEIVSQAHRDINPLWRPPWNTVDPGNCSAEREREEYGSPPDGRLLSGIAGHSLSFDWFGPPSKEETAAGLTTHGEAPAARWELFEELQSGPPGLEYGVTLPEARIAFRRRLHIDPKHPVVYCRETARNLSRADRAICWNEHVTFGPPFLECGSTLVDMPAKQSQVIQAGFSERMMLVPGACFDWPLAPTEGGAMHNLRTTPDGRYSRYTAQLLDSRLDLGYVAVSSPRAGFLLLYLFRRSDFPWVGNWEERFCRETVPWAGKTFCRGLEFSSTPFPGSRREIIAQGPLFNESTYRWLPAESELAVRFVTLLIDIPPDFRGVDRISVADGNAIVHEHEGRRSIALAIDDSFLTATDAGRQ